MAVPCHLDLFTWNFHFGLPGSIQYKPSQHFFQYFFYHFFSISFSISSYREPPSPPKAVCCPARRIQNRDIPPKPSRSSNSRTRMRPPSEVTCGPRKSIFREALNDS